MRWPPPESNVVQLAFAGSTGSIETLSRISWHLSRMPEPSVYWHTNAYPRLWSNASLDELVACNPSGVSTSFGPNSTEE